jgi:AraC family transcriptional regulator
MAKMLIQVWEKKAANARYDANELARICNLSVRQLERQFQHSLSRTPQDWLNERRILMARQLLQSGELVKRIAFDLGFKQSSHFCRQFKRLNGVTPSEFRISVTERSDVAQG